MTTTPARIQRRRTAGWTLAAATTNPLGAVIVSRPSRFGNPFRVEDNLVELIDGRTLACQTPSSARCTAASQYRDWLDGEGPDAVAAGRQVFDRRRVLADLHLLRGKDLACTCPLPAPGQPDHCHAAVLLELANQPAA